jgi:hypothetical protein
LLSSQALPGFTGASIHVDTIVRGWQSDGQKPPMPPTDEKTADTSIPVWIAKTGIDPSSHERDHGVCLLDADRGGDAALSHHCAGLDAAAELGDVFYLSRLHQIRADLLLHAGGRIDEAAASLEEALRVARRQQAKAYELRAATSLARLWGEQGRRTPGCPWKMLMTVAQHWNIQ